MALKGYIKNPWRDELGPGSFDGKEFWVEIGAYECGQRIVIHEFPKKDEPYTEMMGRRYYGFTVRAYCISSAQEPDYRTKRDALQQRLEKSDPGDLILPNTQKHPKHCICRQFRLTEEERLGGYCTFDMQFVEASTPPFKPMPAADYLLFARAEEMLARTLAVLAAGSRNV
jgi:hypothetical protein